MVPDEIWYLAHKVRRTVKAMVRSNNHIGSDMCGACGIASYALWKVLDAAGYKSTLVCGQMPELSWHCWVEFDGHVIDITATQFGSEHPIVSIFPVKEKDDDYKPTFHLRNRRAVNELVHWGEQSPIKYGEQIDRLVRKCLAKLEAAA